MGFVSMPVLFKAVVALQLLVCVYGQLDHANEYFIKPHPPPPPPPRSPRGIRVTPVAAPVAAPKPSRPVYTFPVTRKPVAVQGVVYCKSCNKYAASNDTLTGASPLSGAVVRLKCNNRKYPIMIDGTTDNNGYFFIHLPKVSTFGAHKCRAFLLSSPLASCKNATNLNGGFTGAYLRYERPTKPFPFALFTVGPFAYGPTKCPGYGPKINWG